MSHLYAILAYIGWIWTAIVLIVIAAALWRKLRTRTTPGFDALIPREEQE